MPLKIRAYRAEDRQAVRDICFDTGLMGDSIAPLYGDRESFADMFTAYYTDKEPESCFVVDLDDSVVGYLVGCLDSRRAPSPTSVFTRHVILRALGLRPGTASFVWRGFYDAIVLRGTILVKPDYALYPAHTHFSLLPQARMAPVAAGLYRAFIKYAKAHGCPGLHGEVFAENERASLLHQAMGFERQGRPALAPGMRGVDGAPLHVQLWTRKL
jgi:ribosomal protein S18 acetylase RimI-like enzyme